MTIGKVGNRVFVNSGHSVSRSEVDERFPEANADGSIPWALVEKEVGPDAILGRVAIRDEFRKLYSAETGCPVGDMRALQLLRDYPYDDWRGITVTRQSSLQAWAHDKAQIRAEGIALRTGEPPITDASSGGRR